MKNIELPRKVVTGDGAINSINEIVDELRLWGNSLVIADENTRLIAGDKIKDALKSEIHIVTEAADIEVEKILPEVKKNSVKFLAGVGGGRTIDITKVVALKANIPFLSIPTAASHDGIASPQASLKGEVPTSLKAHSPIGIICDTDILRKAPARLTSAGAADVISNYTAVLDWKLAKEEKGEYYGDYASVLAMLSSEIVIYNALKIKEDISILVEALISSGVAIGIAGSSRPCSGAEHNFSHALDLFCPTPALHGEQCGVGTILMSYLHGADWQNIRDSLKKVGAPTTAKGMGIEDKCIIEALVKAHSVRDRYTILRDGITEEKAKEISKITGVIE